MSRVNWTTMLRTLIVAVTLGATVAVTAACGIEVAAVYSSDGYPSEAYIATTEPVYFEGHAAYWYGDRWYYQVGDRWAHYNREPPALYARRMQAPPQRRAYGPSSARPAVRPAARPAVRPAGRAAAPRPADQR
ncbi:MAG TPA: hypothetical protein VGQ83_15545 [Polyangia bacterium]|jgi:hypothetical protein